MLKILYGPDWTANRDAVLALVAQDVKRERPGTLVMVPELISHDMERRLARLAGDTSSRFAQVLTFSRLAQRVWEYTGQSLDKAMDAGGRVVAMASAARQLSGVLKAYASLETNPEFLTQLVDAVDEFKRCCIGAQDLRRAAGETQGAFAQKLEELSFLLEGYDALCAQSRRDPRDQMNLLLEMLEECSFAAHHRVYVDGFPDFTRQHFAILAHMVRFCPEVTVSLCCDAPGSKQLAYEKPGETMQEFLRFAKDKGIPVQLQFLPGRQNDSLLPLRSNLFQGKSDASVEQVLSLYRCQSPLEECAFAAQRIQQLVAQGCRYRDINVVCPDLEQYRSLLAMTFHRTGVPVYLAGRENVLDKGAIYTVLQGLDSAVGGFDSETVLRYAKSVLSPLGQEECDRVENYALTWLIRGQQWAKPWKLHPGGLHQTWKPEDEALLAELNCLRRRLMDPLMHLQGALQEARTLADCVLGLYHFLEEIHLAERMDTLARQLDSQGEDRAAQELDQLWEILIGALEQLYDVLGHTYWEKETFPRLLRLLLQNYDVGTIPPVLDSVSVGTVTTQRCQQCRHLIVLGALEGSIPSYAGSAGVLSDQERNALRKLGIPLTGGGLDGLKTEYAEIYGCICAAQESVTFLVPPGQESYLVRRLCAMTGLEDIPAAKAKPLLRDGWDVGAYLCRYRQGDLARSLDALEGYTQAQDQISYRWGTVAKENITALYGRELRLSASQIDRQADCRMSYFLRYGLRAQERKEATVDPAEFGTFVHAVLEQTAREVRSLGGFQAVNLEKTLEISQKYAQNYAREHFSQLDSQRMTYLLRRNGAELLQIVEDLWLELQDAKFQPLDFEVRFGFGGEMEAISVPNKAMPAKVLGLVDRVDLWQEEGKSYFRVVDYKTGRKDFDYCDVFNGIGLQMLLYMFALEQGGKSLVGKATGAGVQYFPARAPLIPSEGKLSAQDARKLRQKLRRRNGLVLRSDDVLAAMEPNEPFVLLPCSRKKDGMLTGDLASHEQLAELKRYLYSFLGNMVQDIASGNVQPNPYTRGTSHDACRFCPYGSICREASEEQRRDYQAMNAQRFWEEVHKEVAPCPKN